MAGEFRNYLFDHDHPRLAALRGLDPYAHGQASRADGTFTGEIVSGWRPLYLSRFRGITESGILRTAVHRFEPARPDERAPVEAMVVAARKLLSALDEAGRARLCFPVDAPEWQTWSNPEFIQFDTGLRLEFQTAEVRQRALGLMAASLSPEGFQRTHDTMLINGFLGDIVGLPQILNEFSYNVALYGEPHESKAWGWQVFGHHMALNCMVVAGRMTLSPVFLGAEPNEIDAGTYAGVQSLTTRIDLGIDLMGTLTDGQRQAATIYEKMVDSAMPDGRVHPGDERHLAGAFQDNRVIPFEGVCVGELAADAQERVLAIVEEFVGLLPAGPKAARMREVREYLPETWLCWIGGHKRGDVFYYRVQSPVIIAELDHHCGVFLNNTTPKPFHIHTVLRTPHGNDYGRSYLRQWQQLQE
jgi:hypothetical protein